MKPKSLENLALPVIVAPMFLVSGPDLVKASCLAGVVGSFPFPNARDIATLDGWLDDISQTVKNTPHAAPFAVNLTTHSTYDRLQDEIALIANHKPEIVITALGGPEPVLEVVKSYGGTVIADVNSLHYARKAVDKGVDGLALISAGAGGHTGHMAGFSFVQAVREFFDGLVVLGGGIGTGQAIHAAEIAGADLCYMGTHFIATPESLASQDYKEMVVEAQFEDLVLSDQLTGVKAYYLRQSLIKMGFDPDNMQAGQGMQLHDSQNQIKAWRDVWSAGHGVGSVQAIQPVQDIIRQLVDEYEHTFETLTPAQRRQAYV